MTDFVGEYTTKKKLAELLRKRQEGMLSTIGSVDTGAIVTPGSAGGDGIYAQPSRVQANWGGPIAQLGMAFMNRGAEKKATEAEDAATAARLSALQQVTGGGVGQGGTLSPEQAVQLQELGVDGATLKLMMPSKTNLGAVTQAAQSAAGIRTLVLKGEMTPEQGEQMIAQLEADKAKATADEQAQYKWEQENKSHRPTTPRAETEIEWAQRDPEGWAKFQRDKAKAAMEGKPAPVNPYEKKFQEEQAKVDVKVLEGGSKIQAGIERADKYLAQLKDKPYDGTKYRLMDDAATVVGLPKPSDYSEEVQMQNQDAKQFHLDAMEQMRGFGQVTESEQAIIAATQFDIYDTPAARQKKMETIRAALVRGMEKVEAARARAQAGGGVPGAVPGGDIDAELDALMAQ